MKNRILTFIIGILVGAIIATLGFYMYSKSINNRMPNQFEHQQIQPPYNDNRVPPNGAIPQ